MNMMILRLSGDRRGLRVRVKSMKDNYWHVHSDEMSPYQRIVHRKLVEKK